MGIKVKENVSLIDNCSLVLFGLMLKHMYAAKSTTVWKITAVLLYFSPFEDFETLCHGFSTHNNETFFAGRLFTLMRFFYRFRANLHKCGPQTFIPMLTIVAWIGWLSFYKPQITTTPTPSISDRK